MGCCCTSRRREQYLVSSRHDHELEDSTDHHDAGSVQTSRQPIQLVWQAITIEWKGHGLKIHVPDNSLALSLDPSIHAQLEVHAHTFAFANDGKWYRDSDYLGYIPISSLYSIQMGAGKLCRPVTIEFQHCLDVSDAVHNSDLAILRAADVTEHFEPIDDAVFDKSGYGKVNVPKNVSQEYDNFSSFIVALRRIFLPNTIRYKAYVYTSKKNMKMYFIVTMALETCTTVGISPCHSYNCNHAALGSKLGFLQML